MTSVSLTRPADSTKALKAGLEHFGPSFEKLLPKHYPVDRLITGALIATTVNPSLSKCSIVSIATSLAKVAQWGLDVGETAHLVPFGDKCTAVADYKGLIKLMIEAGARKVEAREVRAGDEFHVEYGTNPHIIHRPSTNRDGAITHYYGVVWVKGGDVQFEVMPAEEVDEIRRKHSKQWKNADPGAWYGRKTVLRRLAKYVNKTPKLDSALNAELVDPETGELPNEPPIIDLPPDDAEVMA